MKQELWFKVFKKHLCINSIISVFLFPERLYMRSWKMSFLPILSIVEIRPLFLKIAHVMTLKIFSGLSACSFLKVSESILRLFLPKIGKNQFWKRWLVAAIFEPVYAVQFYPLMYRKTVFSSRQLALGWFLIGMIDFVTFRLLLRCSLDLFQPVRNFWHFLLQAMIHCIYQQIWR